ncbi:MAG: tetratricopeptide repeat protein [Bacteroidales bacterium]|nr:tetratricopeptide repeat protein [Bacteroidales bacterium]
MKKEYNSILKLLAVLIFAVIPIIFFGQETTEEDEQEPAPQEQVNKKASFTKYGYVGASIGGVAYHGDVYAEPVLPQWKHFGWSFDAIGGWQFHPVLGVRANFGYSNISGERYGDVDLAFRGTEFDYSANATIALINLIFGYNPDRWFEMTAWGGIGRAQYSTDLREQSSADQLEPKASGGATLYPVGVDFDFILSDHWNIRVTSSLKFTDSDQVDYTQHAVAAVKKDFWHHSGIGLTYKFGHMGLKNMVKNFDDIVWDATPDPLEVHGDYVEVTITGEFPPKYFEKDAAMYVTPVLRYEGGAVAYEPFTVKGEDVAGDGMLVNYKNGGTITYTAKIPYSPELNVSELFLVPIIYPAKEGTLATEEDILNSKKYYIIPDLKVDDGVIHTSKYILDNETSIIAYHAYKKENIISKGANIYYLVNRYNLNWRVPLNKLDANKEQLAAVNEFLALGWKIKDIGVSGWASPEGEELFNRDLSENRSTTAYNYMVKEMKKLAKQKGSNLKVEDPKEEVKWDITWQGPDWDGFMANVENSALTDKRAILNVIRSADQSKREEEIRNMILIYPEIEEDMLPPLRRAEITVNCYEFKRSDEQIMAYGLSYPDSLKANELLYAATFYDNNEDQLAIYKSVIKNHPKCYRGYSNAGEVLIDMGEYDEALIMLTKANELKPNDAGILNNLGVLACHVGDYDDAKVFFLEAQQQGADVDYNLGVLAILDGDYATAQKNMSGEECNHNVGLVQLLNKDYNAAQKTFECAPANALTYYLLAITGARQDDTTVLFDNLMKAIDMDPELKNEAKYDREFLKYNELPEFLAIVQ